MLEFEVSGYIFILFLKDSDGSSNQIVNKEIFIVSYETVKYTKMSAGTQTVARGVSTKEK